MIKTKKILFAVLSLLLISATLVAPCFATYIPPDKVPIEYSDITSLVVKYNSVDYLNPTYVTVDVNGFYRMRFTSPVPEGVENATFLYRDINGLILCSYGFTVYDCYEVNFTGRSGQFEIIYYLDEERMFTESMSVPIGKVDFWVQNYRTTPDGSFYDDVEYEVVKVEPPFKADNMLAVSTDTMGWIGTSLASVQSIFYQDGALTFLGVVSIIAVSLGIGWLLINVVVRFFQLRG